MCVDVVWLCVMCVDVYDYDCVWDVWRCGMIVYVMCVDVV